MALFGRSRANRLWTPPSGLITEPQRLARSVPFVYDEDGTPAAQQTISLLKAKEPAKHVNLVKSFDTGTNLLEKAGLPGLRMQVIVILDDSGSMGYEYQDGTVQKLLVRALGFALNLDKDGIPVYLYGRPGQPVTITADNYLDAPRLIQPRFGGTPMTEVFAAAMQLAASYDALTMIINITDGNPNNSTTMSNEVIKSSGHPVILKNLAVRPVDYLEELDDLPSRYEVEKDSRGIPLKDANDNFIIVPNPQGIRLIDNVDSQAVDAYNDSEEVFIGKMVEEITSYLEVAGRVGILTGVPGIDRDPALV